MGSSFGMPPALACHAIGYEQISPRPIGPREGCCGAAAFFKRRVIVADVATDPVWSDENRQLALENGIFAAWSQPILTKDGEVLGTFALYARVPRTPTDAEIELIEGAAQIALIAINAGMPCPKGGTTFHFTPPMEAADRAQ